MKIEKEYWYDKNCVFIGDIEETDESFDHAFGTQKVSGFNVKDFSVVVYIGSIDHDITKCVSESAPRLFEFYKQWFINQYLAEKGANV